VNALKRQVTEMRREAPARPEDVLAREAMRGEKPDFLRVTRGNADYGGPVGRDMERLQGRSRNDTVSDTVRGSGSPLGHGEGRRRK